MNNTPKTRPTRPRCHICGGQTSPEDPTVIVGAAATVAPPHDSIRRPKISR